MNYFLYFDVSSFFEKFLCGASAVRIAISNFVILEFQLVQSMNQEFELGSLENCDFFFQLWNDCCSSPAKSKTWFGQISIYLVTKTYKEISNFPVLPKIEHRFLVPVRQPPKFSQRPFIIDFPFFEFIRSEPV